MFIYKSVSTEKALTSCGETEKITFDDEGNHTKQPTHDKMLPTLEQYLSLEVGVAGVLSK